MKKRYRHICVYIVFFLCVMHTYCDAPRNNPLDPKNPDSILCSIAGNVLTITDPRGIPDVKVYWENDDRLTFTDDDGHFTIQDVNPENGWLTFSREGYLPNSVEVIWENKKNVNLQVSLNAKPHLDSISVYSVIFNKHPDLKISRIVIKAKISDSDSDYDIDSVYVENSHLNIRQALEYDRDDQVYEKTFSLSTLNITSIEQAVGYDFEVIVVDRSSHTISVGGDRIRRVIHNEVQYDSPRSWQVVPPSPQLMWYSFNPGFTFTFMIEVFTAEIISEKVWEKSNIASDRTDFTLDITLPNGDYYWIIWCIDEFQNRASSKPASFTIE